MMLAYQPVRALSTLNITIKSRYCLQQQEFYQLLIDKNRIHRKTQNLSNKITNAWYSKFKNVSFKYEQRKENVTL